jgi:internalin A
MSNLKKLTTLSLDGNLLGHIPPEILGLTNLTTLNIGDNPLHNIDPAISTLTSLKDLQLYMAGLSTLPTELEALINLAALSLWNNRFTEVPPVISRLTNLSYLDFENLEFLEDKNAITEIPRSLVLLPKLSSLNVRNNPIRMPPPEIAFKDLDSIGQFYQQVDRAGEDYLHEAKLLIVGEAGAGKTSFAKKLVHAEYPLSDTEKSTEGIAITDWTFDDQRFGSFAVHIWDFGGQEIYHSTHQFFLTKRSLYVLITDSRKEDADFFYWLNVIELLSAASPVIIVQNEKQDRYQEIDYGQLRERFPNLLPIKATNLETNRGLDEVTSEIRHYITILPHVGTPLPKTWVEVRRELEQHSANTIPFDEYLDICTNHGFAELSDKLTLIGYLHDLGVCLHFSQDPLLKRILILKPRWGTDAVYKVLDNQKVIQQFGSFNRADLASIWVEPEYLGMHDELLQLMLNFKICYAIPGSPDFFIAPQRLSDSRPAYDWDSSNNLIIRYLYEPFEADIFQPKRLEIY